VSVVTSSNPSVVDVGTGGVNVAGLAAGTAELNVVFATPKGQTTAKVEVTVKEERPIVQTIKVANSSFNAANVAAVNAQQLEALTGKITITDQYGTEYVIDPAGDDDVTTGNLYHNLLNIRFFISNV